jgi:hypothetical protein
VTNPPWADVRAAFESLVDENPQAARRQLEALRREAPEVAAEVEALLGHHDQVGAFLDQPPAISTDDDILVAGTLLGVYRIEREIGSGGMGRVYLATDTRLGRPVALKMVRGDLAEWPSLRARLRSEAQLAASISHPGICSVHALEEIGDTLFLVTEYVEGETLRAVIKRGTFSADALASTARELASALEAAHRKGITHRDLKPENIMRTTEGRLKILDFGLARAERAAETGAPAMTLPGTVVGTIAYMAPEQLEGRSVDGRTDLFALGIILYECATGRHPFSAATALATSARILETEPTWIADLRPDLPRGLASAIVRCLAKAPGERFQSASALLAAVDGQSTPAAAAAVSSIAWWRIHQIVVIGLYAVAATVAWNIKEWDGTRPTRWAFLAIGVIVAIAGITRAHLLFTERAYRHRLTNERRRTDVILRVADLTTAVLLFLDALAIADGRPVAAVLIMALAVGVAVATLLIEPSTTVAAFDTSSA